MANYSFLHEAKVYVVYGSEKLQLDISSISFSQTYTDETYPVRTIHNQNNLFEGSVINKANPANFELTIPALIEDDIKIIFNRLIDVQSFHLYIATNQDVFKIETCVITNGTFNIERSRPLSLTVSGEASKVLTGQTLPSELEVWSDSKEQTEGHSNPLLRTSSTVRTYNLTSDLSVALAGTEISSHMSNLSVQLQNGVQWLPYSTVNVGIGNSIMFPIQYSLSGRTLSGNITRYLNDTTESGAQAVGLNQALRIKAGTMIGGLFKGFDFNMTNVSFTNRIETGDVFQQSYDWRLAQNVSSLAGILTYYTQS